MRILTLLAAPRARAKEMPTIALPDLPHDTRCHLFDKTAAWRLPVLRRLAAQVAGASPTDRMPWVDIPAWLDAIEVVDDYRDRADLATKRDLIVRDIPKSGFLRRLAPPPDPAVVEGPADEYPNFAPVIEHTADQLAIAALGNGWLRLPAVLLLGEPGIGKSVFADALAATLGVKCRRFTMSHATQGGALGGLAAYWGTGTTGEVFNVLLRGEALNLVFVLDEIDKAAGTTEGRFNPLGPLYSLLEPEDAKQFVDEYAGLPIDASWFSWVATANDLHVLPAPIVSRLLVFDIRSPTRAELRQIGRRQYWRLVDDCGLAGYLPVEAPATLLDQVEVSPRELRVLMQRAIGRMARDCRTGREMRAELPGVKHEQRRRMAAHKVKAEFTNWRFLTLQIHSDQLQKRNIYVLGLRAGRLPMMTSSVRRIDFEEGLVQTKNSVYRLRMDARGTGEPPQGQLIHICATLNDWGVGPALGVPAFYY